LIIVPIVCYLLAAFVIEIANVVASIKSTQQLVWEASFPGICGFIGLLFVLLLGSARRLR
jgi:hypothetical protein